MRILHVAQPTEAGVARYVGQVAADQRRRGWETLVACPPTGTLPDTLWRAGLPHRDWNASRSPGPGTVREIQDLRRLVEDFRPDVVHLHSSKAGLAGRIALRERTPTLFQPHGWSWLAVQGLTRTAAIRWERAATRWTTASVCVGLGELELGWSQGLQGRFEVIRNGVDLDVFRPASAGDRVAWRRALRLDATAPLVVCVGRIGRQKGQDVLLQAWPEILVRCPDARLALVGEGFVAGRTPGVITVGAVGDPLPWYAAADVVAMPSRWEGLPLTLLEALAVGRSVVGSDIPGISEALPAETGALVEAGDPAALARAVGERLTHPDLAASEGAAAARHATNYDLRGMLDALATLTWSVAEGHRPP